MLNAVSVERNDRLLRLQGVLPLTGVLNAVSVERNDRSPGGGGEGGEDLCSTLSASREMIGQRCFRLGHGRRIVLNAVSVERNDRG